MNDTYSQNGRAATERAAVKRYPSAARLFLDLPHSRINRIAPEDRVGCDRLLMLIDRQPPDQMGTRVLPLDYAMRVLGVTAARIRELLSLAQRECCLTSVIIAVTGDVKLDEPEAYILAGIGAGDFFWYGFPVREMLGRARERCIQTAASRLGVPR